MLSLLLQKIFGSNPQAERACNGACPTLHDKKVRENPSLAYAALRAARLSTEAASAKAEEKFAPSDTSFIRAAGLGFEPR